MIDISEEKTEEKKKTEKKLSEETLKKINEIIQIPGLSNLLPIFNFAHLLSNITLPTLNLPEITTTPSTTYESSDFTRFKALYERLNIIEAKIDYIVEIFEILTSPETYKKTEPEGDSEKTFI